MSRRRIITAVPLALVGLGLVSVPASAEPHERNRIVQPVTATFTSQVPTAQGFDATADIYARGHKVGTQDLSCRGGGTPGTALQCDFVLTYDGGGTVAGSFVSPAGSRAIDGTIDGGTGYYDGATGVVSGRATESGAKIVIRLQLPSS